MRYSKEKLGQSDEIIAALEGKIEKLNEEILGLQSEVAEKEHENADLLGDIRRL